MAYGCPVYRSIAGTRGDRSSRLTLGLLNACSRPSSSTAIAEDGRKSVTCRGASEVAARSRIDEQHGITNSVSGRSVARCAGVAAGRLRWASCSNSASSSAVIGGPAVCCWFHRPEDTTSGW